MRCIYGCEFTAVSQVLMAHGTWFGCGGCHKQWFIPEQHVTEPWQPEPPPFRRADKKPIYLTVIEELRAKAEAGRAKYGTDLTADNGRRALRDLYQELLDATLYVRQKIEEEEGDK